MNSFISHQQKAISAAMQYFRNTLSFTPDDKITYSPSPTAKSTLALAAHIAITNKGFASMLQGKPSKFTNLKSLLLWLDEEEKKITSRDAVLTLLDESEKLLLETVEGLSEDGLDTIIQGASGPRSVRDTLAMIGPHIRMHAAQIDYLQTIWGDTDPHF